MTLNDARAEQRSSPRAPLWLPVIAVLETLSLAVLVTNRLTLDLRGLAAVLGPIHGGLYLTVIIAAALLRLGARNILLALIPVVGGLLVLRATRLADDLSRGTVR